MRISTLNAIKNASVRNALINAAINGTLDIDDDEAAVNAVRDEDGKRVKVGDRICAVAFDGRELFVTKVGNDYVFARPVGGGGVSEWELHDGEFIVCNATAVNYGDNPNYTPEAGMRMLAERFDMFDPKVAQGMIRDAQRKGVTIPATVIAKAKRAGILNAKLTTWNPVVANAIAWNGDGDAVAANGDWDQLAQIYIDRAIEAEKLGNAHKAARYKERANDLVKIMRRADEANDNRFEEHVA